LLWRSDRIDFVFRIEEVGHLPKILSAVTGEDVGNDEKWEEYLKMRQHRENPTQANVIIQTGCDNFCAFCIVPHTRGRELSRPVSDVVAETSEAVAGGAKEIWLLGQNVNSYGKETRAKLWDPEALTWNFGTKTGGSGSASQNLKEGFGESDRFAVLPSKTPFRELLEAVGAVEGVRRLRFTSSNPHDMTRDILDAHFEIPAMMPYLHLALQSGSDAVLRRMNRKHTVADFRAQVEYLRSKDPFFAVSTDLIVGFPGETEEDFQATLAVMEACQFDFAFIARYSSRKGTMATDKLGDDIPAEIKADRWNRANAVLEGLAARRNAMMVGRTDEVLVTGKGRTGGFVGRTRNFKETFFETEGLVSVGDIVPVRITGVDGWVLKGEPI
jgi:tRNA-2-methylthio-N6-dimethylallyladenosine synthase